MDTSTKNVTIIILTYNVKDLTRNCLTSLQQSINNLDQIGFTANIVVSDNASSDGTVQMVRSEFPSIQIVENQNIGFAKGNNAARSYVTGKYILILNPDTVVEENTLLECVKYIEENPDVGALTCKTEMPDGSLDMDARRAFPTPFNAITHFTFLDRIFPKSKIFAQYWYTYIPENTTHEVDVIQGAFSLIRTNVMEEVNWYDTDYFLDGEDIDLCWKIKQAGYKIIYYPQVKIIHYKGASKGKSNNSNLNKKVSKKTKLISILTGVNSMKIFYDKHLKNDYPWLLNQIVYLGIFSMKLKRAIKFLVSGNR